jgi:serralysin
VLRALALLVVLLLASCANAYAATATSIADDVSYAAAAGETNQLQATERDGAERSVVLHDDGAEITAGPGCDGNGPHEVICRTTATGEQHPFLRAQLADGDDVASVASPLLGWLIGGDGNDRLSGACQLDGGPGDDALTACASLDQAQSGAGLTGGPGNDTLIGSDEGNRLDGGPGNDFVAGAGGDDQIVDSGGADTLTGGAGDDKLLSRDLYKDAVDCGPGSDGLAADRADSAAACEGNQSPPLDLMPPRIRVKGGRTLIAARCSFELAVLGIVTEGLDSCSLRLKLWVKSRGKRILAGQASCASSISCTYRIPLRRQARRLLAHESLAGVIEIQRLPAPGAVRTQEPVTVVRGR